MTTKPAYNRRLIFKNRRVETVLITWPPGCRSRPHDHGRSRGTIIVLKGQVFEDLYSKRLGTIIGATRLHREGAVIFEDETAHVMGNRSKLSAVTLHVYRPPLRMRYYPLPP